MIKPPPIRENMFMSPGVLAKIWVKFFNNIHEKVTSGEPDVNHVFNDGPNQQTAVKAEDIEKLLTLLPAEQRDFISLLNNLEKRLILVDSQKDYSKRLEEIENRLLQIQGNKSYDQNISDLELLCGINQKSDYSVSGRLTMRPALVAGRISAGGGIPTAVAIGSHAAYSLPIWSTPANQYEELYFRELIAGRWNGASDITVSVICALSATEDVGDNFKLELSWENKETASGVISTSTTDVYAEQAVITGREAQYSIYKLDFAIDWDLPAVDVTASDHIGFRLRRVDAADPDISNELLILDVIITYTVNKIYK